MSGVKTRTRGGETGVYLKSVCHGESLKTDFPNANTVPRQSRTLSPGFKPSAAGALEERTVALRV